MQVRGSKHLHIFPQGFSVIAKVVELGFQLFSIFNWFVLVFGGELEARLPRQRRPAACSLLLARGEAFGGQFSSELVRSSPKVLIWLLFFSFFWLSSRHSFENPFSGVFQTLVDLSVISQSSEGVYFNKVVLIEIWRSQFCESLPFPSIAWFFSSLQAWIRLCSLALSLPYSAFST